MPVRYEQPIEGWTPPEPTSRRPRLLLIALAVAAVLVGGLLVALALGGDDKKKEPTPPTAVGLEKGGATALTGGTGQVGDMRVGFPRTVDGAASAVMSYTPALDNMYFDAENLNPIARYMDVAGTGRNLTEAELRKVTEEFRKEAGLDPNGNVLRADGTVDPSRTCVRELLPAYGAYRITKVEGAESAPTGVTVELWVPWVRGTVPLRNPEDVGINWMTSVSTVIWHEGDWRLDEAAEFKEAGIQPLDKSDLLISFEERSRLLPSSDGWLLPGDATESDGAVPWER